MKLEDIKKMSNEEFIEFVNSMNNKQGKLAELRLINESLSAAIPSAGGVLIGFVSYLISTDYTDDKFMQGTAAILGTIIGIPILKKIIRYMDSKLEQGYSNELIEIKKSIENLTEEEFLILKGTNSSNVRQLQKQMKMTFDKKIYNKFIDSLEPSYKDDEENLGYSKNIGKNN